MAEVAVDERRLLKTIRWWDGFVIGLANPGFLLIGLWGSIIALGGQWAIALWIISAVIGALQAYRIALAQLDRRQGTILEERNVVIERARTLR